MNENQLPKSNLEPLWTVTKTAQYLGLSIHTIYNWVSKKKIKFFKISSQVRIPKSEVERIVGKIKGRLEK